MTAAFFVSASVVALAEIGDKTQLLSLLLAARFRKPLPIISGILFATLANHALAGVLGEWVRARLAPEALRWLLAASLVAIAAWTLRPDRLEREPEATRRYGVFVLTLIAFFLVEMGDKTQIATVVLAAQFHALAAVVFGTTLGMLVANVPVVLAGAALAERIPLRAVRIAAAASFAVLAAVALLLPAGS
ncbi:MAG TPA: TMEM165/GDT1 family protein [Burkholderiales bacterium]|nr:TMEM165/GDT1 family protein [Burkholderiales bacterium]